LLYFNWLVATSNLLGELVFLWLLDASTNFLGEVRIFNAMLTHTDTSLHTAGVEKLSTDPICIIIFKYLNLKHYFAT